MSIYDVFGKQSTPNLDEYSLQQKMQELQNIRQQQQQPQASSKSPQFDRLESFASNFSSEKNKKINEQALVNEKRTTMMAAFQDFVWANLYKQFDSYCEENKLPYCKDYVDSFINGADKYVSPIDEQNQVIAQQNKTIEELKQQITGLTSTKRGELL